MKEHTPGPWRVLTFDADGVVDRFYGVQMGRTAGFRVEGPDAEANTRLIAAAPELLDRVKDAVLVLEAIRENWGDDHSGLLKTIDEELPPLRAAIAKAEGR